LRTANATAIRRMRRWRRGFLGDFLSRTSGWVKLRRGSAWQAGHSVGRHAARILGEAPAKPRFVFATEGSEVSDVLDCPLPSFLRSLGPLISLWHR
jgi:hypothetical protein